MTGVRRKGVGEASWRCRRVAGWLAFATMAAACAQSPPGARHGTVAATAFAEKLSADAQARALLPGTDRVTVLIRTAGPLSAAERRALHDTGVEVIGVSGDVVSASLQNEALERLAALPFVRYVELSRALGVAPEDAR